MIWLSPHAYDAVLFDLDGVLTDTAATHAVCWKRMFDAFLHDHAARSAIPFREFDIDRDYKQYVDGRPRVEGVRSFLRSRSISLPEGDPQDSPDAITLWGLGNRKNALFNETLREVPPAVYPGSVALLRAVRAAALRTAVVSASRNARAVLQATDLASLFETCIDGVVASQRGLAGKPAPDTFLEAVGRLRASPSRAVVIEDAEAGVAAATAGGFALVIGVARHGEAESLRRHGAHVVVNDLSEVGVNTATEKPNR